MERRGAAKGGADLGAAVAVAATEVDLVPAAVAVAPVMLMVVEEGRLAVGAVVHPQAARVGVAWEVVAVVV